MMPTGQYYAVLTPMMPTRSHPSGQCLPSRSISQRSHPLLVNGDTVLTPIHKLQKTLCSANQYVRLKYSTDSHCYLACYLLTVCKAPDNFNEISKTLLPHGSTTFDWNISLYLVCRICDFVLTEYLLNRSFQGSLVERPFLPMSEVHCCRYKQGHGGSHGVSTLGLECASACTASLSREAVLWFEQTTWTGNGAIKQKPLREKSMSKQQPLSHIHLIHMRFRIIRYSHLSFCWAEASQRTRKPFPQKDSP